MIRPMTDPLPPETGLRDPDRVRALAKAINRLTDRLGRRRFMEVCGSHTMAIAKFGLKQLIPEVELISGPGCPVCVTATGEIDRAVDLAQRAGVTTAAFGDMIRVPGSGLSLSQARAGGGSVEIVYSPLDAVDLARQRPDRQIVFLGIGFETTAPTSAAAVVEADRAGLDNFSLLSCHKLLTPGLLALLGDGRLNLDGFLMPGHVSTIIGARAYQKVVADFGQPSVVTGFEPTDILAGILMLLNQIADGRAEVEIQYTRAVDLVGSGPALAMIDRVFQPIDSVWRGLGPIPGGGLALRPELAAFDAVRRFGLDPTPDQAEDPPGCRCGQVLRGALAPTGCPLFGRACTPEQPVGPCMVSGEGACAAHYRYPAPEN